MKSMFRVGGNLMFKSLCLTPFRTILWIHRQTSVSTDIICVSLKKSRNINGMPSTGTTVPNNSLEWQIFFAVKQLLLDEKLRVLTRQFVHAGSWRSLHKGRSFVEKVFQTKTIQVLIFFSCTFSFPESATHRNPHKNDYGFSFLRDWHG